VRDDAVVTAEAAAASRRISPVLTSARQ